MLNEIFRLFGTIAINNDEANKAIDKTNDKAGKLHTAMNSAFSKIGKAASVCGRAVVTGLAAGTAAMGALVAKSMGLAGELEQNLGGSEAVFGGWAAYIQEKGAEAFAKLGLSQAEYLANANKMGSLFKGMGFSTQEAATMSADAMQRAADVASIMGISQEAAMEAVAGMAKGNYTMMDNLGVAMNDTALAAYAVEKGITKSYQKMSQNEKIGLAYQMFMEKSAYAAGNYAKENDTLAGSLSTAKAAWQNFLSGSNAGTNESGINAMVESFVNVGDVVTKNLNKILPKLTKGLTTLIQRLTPYVPEMMQAVLPGLIDGAMALITGLALALPDILEVLTEQLPYIMDQLIASLDTILPALVTAISAMFATLAADLPALLQNIGAIISKVWKNGVWPLIQNLFRAWFGVELPSWDAIEQSISAGWAQIETSVREWFKATFGITLPDWETVRNNIVAWWTRFKNKVGEFIKAVFGLDFSDKDKDGVLWYTRLKNWLLDVLKATGGMLLALVGLDFSDADKDGKSWFTKLGQWLLDILATTGGMLLALVGIDVEAMAKNITDTINKIEAWWEQVKASIALSLGFTVDPPGTGEPPPSAGTAYGGASGILNPGGMNGDTTAWDDRIGGFASGLDFVPRDDFAARLHYGEAVLTQSEATAWRNGQQSGIDYDRLAEAMAQRPMAFNIDGKSFAVMLARELSRTIGNRNIQSLMAMGG